MTKTRKKLAAVLLAVAMVVTFMPVLGTQTAYAQGESTYAKYDSDDNSLTFFTSSETYTNGQTEGTVTYYAGFADAELEYDDLPWAAVRENITTVDFEDTISPASTAYWFCYFNKLTAINNIAKLDTSNVTSMRSMFYECKSLTSLNVSDFCTSNVTSMRSMFYNCESLSSLDVSNFDTSKVESMELMFSGCSALESLDVSGFDTSNVTGTGLNHMFNRASSIKELDLSSFDTSKVTSLTGMFMSASSLEKVDLSSFYIPNVTATSFMFSECSKLTTIYVDPSIWDASGVTTSIYMFGSAPNLPGYDSTQVDAAKAVVTEEGGYFTSAGSLATATVSGIVNKAYTGTAIAQTPIVKKGAVTLTSGTDYSVSYKNNVNAGTASVIIAGKGNYTGTITKTFKINKAANPLSVKSKTATVKYSKLKKKNQTLAVTKVITFTKKGQGTMTYTKASGNKKITINKKTGKVTVKKGLKKGTYKVKVKVKAAGNSNYKASGWKTVTFKVKVK